MITRMPAARHSRIAAGTDSRSGSAKPTRPSSSKRKCRRASPGRSAHALVARATASTRRPSARQRVDLRVAARRRCDVRQPAQRRRSASGAPFGAPRTYSAPASTPDLRHRQESGRSGYSRSSVPVVRRSEPPSSRQVRERALHRIDGMRSLARVATSSSCVSDGEAAMRSGGGQVPACQASCRRPVQTAPRSSGCA